MKTKKLLLGLALIANSVLFAQPWMTFGGNAVGATSYLGTINAQPLQLRTSLAQPILFQTNGLNNKMLIAGSVNGFTAFGDNIAGGFVPVDRIHLIHTAASQVRMRFTNLTTGSTVNDGTALGIQANGDFRLTQFEKQNIDFYTPSIITSGIERQRAQITDSGQVLIGNNIVAENVVHGDPITGFSTAPSSLLNVRGPINSCAPFNPANPLPTILYGYTPPYGSPGAVATDGFRMHMNYEFKAVYYDALVFEKTDGNGLLPNPNGYIAFTNTGHDGIEELSAYFNGDGRAYIGANIDTVVKTRLTIDSHLGDLNPLLNDATKSGLRFVNLTAADTATITASKVLSVDSVGNVILVNAGSGFALCADTLSGKLADDSKLDFNEHNLYLVHDTASVDPVNNKLGVGYLCGGVLPSKLSVYQNISGQVNVNTSAGHFLNKDVASLTKKTFIGVEGHALGNQVFGLNPSVAFTSNLGGYFTAKGAGVNVGVKSLVDGTSGANYGADFRASGSMVQSFGVKGFGSSNGGTSSGGYFIANGNNVNYGVYASASFGSLNRAGYFVGQTETTAGAMITSDEQFKRQIEDEKDALDLLKRLKPRTYFMKISDYPQFNFSDKRQHGFVAQEIEQYLPELLVNSYHPGETDSVGNVLFPSTTYKSLNYTALTSINTQAINELNKKVDDRTLSDQSLKTDVNDLSASLDKVIAMHGITYSWDYANHPEMDLDSLSHIGFIAQEMNAVEPLLTFVDSDHFMHVDYEKVVPVLAESIQELNGKLESKDSIIDALNERLTRLENCLSALLPSLCELNQSAIQQNTPEAQEQLKSNLEVTLSNRNSIVLSQNVPNPFAESTVIEYNVPATVQKAQILFYDKHGKLINAVDVTERGKGELNVFASDLSSGIYTYSLVTDGKVSVTKKMVKE